MDDSCSDLVRTLAGEIDNVADVVAADVLIGSSNKFCRRDGGSYNTFSVPEMADASENHRHVALVGRGNHFFIAN